MTTLYIANTSKQKHLFIYRRAEATSTTPPIEIPPGTQVMIGKNLSPEEVDSIIEHHGHYGMVNARDAARADNFVGLCYSIDKPISEENMELTYDHNDEILDAIAESNREKTAVAISANLESALESTHSAVKVGRVEVEVTEEAKIGQPQRVNAGVEVLKEGTAPRRNHG